MTDPLPISAVPFSHFGAYTTFTTRDDGNLDMETAHRNDIGRGLFRLSLLNEGKPEEAGRIVHATFDDLCFASSVGSVHIRFLDSDTLEISGNQNGLRFNPDLSQAGHSLQLSTKRWILRLGSNRLKFILEVPQGHAVFRQVAMKNIQNPPTLGLGFDLIPENGSFRAILREATGAGPLPGCWEPEGCAMLETFLARMGPAPEQNRASTWRLAGYILWSATVRPWGHVQRPTILMSKNWMTNCWSWDHAFNALGLWASHPQLAWDQWCAPFDHQGGNGVLPDLFADNFIDYFYTKPPVHAWALGCMDRIRPLSMEQLEAAYTKLSAWMRWWLRERDPQRDSLLEYHGGCESGWDNSTNFIGMEMHGPRRSPDLNAVMVNGLDVLAGFAVRLARLEEAEQWTAESERLLAALLGKLWNGDQFRPDPDPGEGDTLLNFLPLILGARLPSGVLKKMVDGLLAPGRFFTPHGLASEAITSAHYTTDGYWLGPVWAPCTLQIVDGLARAGMTAEAREIAMRFVSLCARSGFAENFDAPSGAPLRDRAYTWTASVYLFLERFLASDPPQH